MRVYFFVALVLGVLLMAFGCRDTVDSGHDWQHHADFFVGGTIYAQRDTANCDREKISYYGPDSFVVAFNDSVYTMTSSGAWSLHVEHFDPYMISDDPRQARLSVYDLNTWNLQEDPRDSFHVADTTWLVLLEQVEEGHGDWYLGLFGHDTRRDTLPATVYPELWPDAPPAPRP